MNGKIPFHIELGIGVYHDDECLMEYEDRDDANDSLRTDPIFRQLRSIGIRPAIRRIAKIKARTFRHPSPQENP